jgi:hypothetical protein
MHRPLLAILLLCTIPAYAASNASVICTYFTLDDAREVLKRCGKSVESDRNQRYIKLHKALEQFIHKNGPANVGDLMAEQKRATRARLANPDICEGRDFSFFNQMFEQLTSPAGTAAVLENLKTPKDPMEGDCV